MIITASLNEFNGHVAVTISTESSSYSFLLNYEDEGKIATGVFGLKELNDLHKMLDLSLNRRALNMGMDVDELIYLADSARRSKYVGDFPAFKSAIFAILELIKGN